MYSTNQSTVQDLKLYLKLSDRINQLTQRRTYLKTQIIKTMDGYSTLTTPTNTATLTSSTRTTLNRDKLKTLLGSGLISYQNRTDFKTLKVI